MVPTRRDLIAFFRRQGTPRAAWRVGIEHEKIAVRADGQPVPLSGESGVEALLRRLAGMPGYAADGDGGGLPGVRRGEESITLEPGAQVEFSSAPLPDASACAEALAAHVRDMSAAAAPLGIYFVGCGYRPFGTLDDAPWALKSRYAVMRDLLPRRGKRAHEMMKQTATVQASLDFEDEADAAAKVRVALGATSVVTAMFAASPLIDGKPSGFKSTRAAVWLETDEDRCGVLPLAFKEGFALEDYVDWALDVPMLFLVRAGRYHAAGNGMTFRRFLNEGWRGESAAGASATIDDWRTHLTTLFPEVRLKHVIELRGADAGPLPFAKAVGALWRGLLDDPDARAAAWEVVGPWALDDRLRLRREVPRAGLAAEVSGRKLAGVAVELCGVARAGLARLPGGGADRALIEPVLEYAARGRCPADDMLDDHRRLGGDPTGLVAAWDIAGGAPATRGPSSEPPGGAARI